jgi:lysozyme family protein
MGRTALAMGSGVPLNDALKPKPFILASTQGSSFEDAALATFGTFEGGYVNDPDDPGGETKFGISKRSYPNEDIANLTIERAKFLAKRDYWYPMRLDTLNCQMIANNLFDFAFHHGVRSVGKKFQFILSRPFGFDGKIDGILGSATLGFANELIRSGQGAAFALHMSLVRARLEYYLATAKPKYLTGFIKRAVYFL